MIYTYSIPQGGEINIIAGSWMEANRKFKAHMKDICEHVEFENEVCVDCDYKCEHPESNQYHECIDCGKYIEPADYRCEPEYGDSDR